MTIDLEGLSDADALAVQEAWRDALFGAGTAAPADQITRVVAPLAGVDRAVMLSDLSQRVTLAAIDARAGELWMLHAAGAAAADGRVVVLVGPSGSGKTTAARVLGAPFSYVTDEAVGIDADGRVWPYRKPLSVVEDRLPKAQRAPSELGLQALPGEPLRVGAIGLLDRSDDAADVPVIARLDLGDALEDLVTQSSHLTSMSAPLRTIAAHAAAAGGIARVTYREAASLPGVVAALLSEESATDRAHARIAASSARPVGEAFASIRELRDAEDLWYSRAATIDELSLEDPDRIAVLTNGAGGGGTVSVLAGIAPAIWRAADAASLASLTDAALAAYGVPVDTDAEKHVLAAVDTLVAQGILVEEANWRVRGDVAWTDSGDRIVALALSEATATPLALEGEAALIWRALAEGAGPADVIAQRVAASAGVEADAISDEVLSFLARLQTAALVARG